LASLSEQEIQKRAQLGLVTPSLDGSGAAVSTIITSSEDEELEDWQDITEEQDKAKSDDDDDEDSAYVFDTQRRSSVDLDNMTANAHDSALIGHNAILPHVSTGSFALYDNNPNKRQRARSKPSFASIREEEPLGRGCAAATTTNTFDDEEIATVDGNDDVEDMEIRDANDCV
jgi:hypothetical protein